MKFPFKELPGSGQVHLRPVVFVEFETLRLAPQACLIDSGALHNRFGAWVARAAGIDLSGSEESMIALAGFTTTTREARLQLKLADHTWEAPVWFCDPWPLDFHLLGQEGFLKWFDVRLRAAVYEMEITPEA